MGIADNLDWKAVYDEAEKHFQQLLRFDTTNPPGNELAAAEYLAEVFSAEGMEPEVIKSADDRGNVVCRLKGDGTKPPVLLSGHLDVVPAGEPSEWKYPPFSGEKAEGYIWGRGALDMKNMVAYSLMSILLHKRSGVTRTRDIIFAAVADEEEGCEYGSRFLVENHADKVKAEYCLSEFGGFSMPFGKLTFYPVQTAEKGICWFKVKAQGPGGHASVPEREAALVKLGQAMEKLGKGKLPQHNTDAAETFIGSLAKHLPMPMNKVIKLLLNPTFSNLILEKAFPDKALASTFYALLHNTTNPTVIHAGEKDNKIPIEATLTVDGRILPGQTPEGFLKEVRELIGPGYDISIKRAFEATVSDPDDPIFPLMQNVIEKHDPGAKVIPYMVPGFTDANSYSKLGIKCYGFSPVKLGPDDVFRSLIHGVDERIPVEGFRFGVRALMELMEQLVG